MSRSALSLLVAALAALGCAHAQTARVQDAVAAPPTPAAPASTPARQTQIDLAALFHGDVLKFDFDSTHLSAESQSRLRAIAPVLAEHGNLKVRIEGNCDERGTEDYNLQLGQARANAARSYLVELGVSSSQISTVSYGVNRPANPAHTEQAWAENRRDDIRPIDDNQR